MKQPIIMGGHRAAIIAHFPPGEPAELKIWRDRQEFRENEHDPFIWLKFLDVQSIDALVVVLSRMRNAMAKPKPEDMWVVD